MSMHIACPLTAVGGLHILHVEFFAEATLLDTKLNTQTVPRWYQCLSHYIAGFQCFSRNNGGYMGSKSA